MSGGVFDSDSIYSKIAEQEELQNQSDFWDNPEKAQKVMSKIKALKLRVDPWKELINDISDIEAMYELAEESGDADTEQEIRTMLEEANKKYEKQSVLNLLSGEVDNSSAFLTIHAGAGGTEAEDWAFMLSRMYTRWAERRGFKIETVDILEAEGGIKSVTFQIDARRHTSFSSVFVFPVLDDSIEVEIRPEDLRVDTYRAGGKGGQHVNKTDSAVRFTHLPTGIVVACQSERSQIFNRQACMSMLKAKLYEYYREQKEKENSKFATEKKDIGWGNQIRSYVFQPYTMVKDHRTKCESGNIQAVMDGDIDQFIEAYLKAKWTGAPMDDTDDGDDL